MPTSGTVTLSIEIELGWGGEGVDEYISKDRMEETEYLERLIDSCELHNIPITFDIVGALIDSERDCDHRFEEKWGVNRVTAEYYVIDLIEQIQESDISHEFATHTYSHYIFDNEKRFLEEVNETKRVHERNGLGTPTTFVAPRNKIPPSDVLEKTMIDTVRTPVSSPVSSNVHRFFKVLYRTHPVTNIETDRGIVRTNSTWETSLTAPYFLPMGQKSAHPAYNWLPLTLRKAIHRRYLRSALRRTISQQSHSHFWTHLYNMSNQVQWELVMEFLAELGESQRLGEVNVKTMGDLEEVIDV